MNVQFDEEAGRGEGSRTPLLTRDREKSPTTRKCASFALLCLALVFGMVFLAYVTDIGGGNGDDGDGEYKGHPDRPNILLFYVDDLGYGDLAVHGHPTTRTPSIDRLFAQGMAFTQTVSENSVCTPSRAALLTGRHAVRMGLADDALRVLVSPLIPGGLLSEELTIADVLRSEKNYTSAFIGKWHLGINKNTSTDAHFMPTQRGFDYYYGMPTSHGPPCTVVDPNPLFCFIYENEEIVRQPPDMLTMTRDVTEKAMGFMQNAVAARTPFFVTMAYQKMHTPLFPSEAYQNTSRRGAYGDDLAELDASMNRILRFLDELGMTNNTIVVFTSDNGPYLEESLDGGSAGIFRGGKAQTWEGGFRVPFVWRWPARIEANVRNYDFVTTMDFLPTLADLLDVTLPQDRLYDGKSFAPLLLQSQGDASFSEISKSEDREFAYFCGERLTAVRTGPYKVHFATQRWLDDTTQSCPAYGPIGACGCTDAMMIEQDPPLVFHLEHDPSERHPLPPPADFGAANSTSPLDEYARAVAAATRYRAQLLTSVEPIENQLRLPADEGIQPCCNPPACLC